MLKEFKHERTCAVCRKKGEKDSFIRIVKQKDGSVEIDKTYKLNGRGVYICSDKLCVEKAIKTRVLNRSFKTEIDSQVYNDLGRIL